MAVDPKPLGSPAPRTPAPEPRPAVPERRPTLAETLAERTATARHSLKIESRKLARLLAKLAQDLERAEGAGALREQAEVLKTFVGSLPRGASRWQGPVPWEPDRTLDIALRPDLSAADNLQKLFQRARGLARGAALIAGRQDDVGLRALEVEDLQGRWVSLQGRAEAWQLARDSGQSPPERPRDLLAEADKWLLSVGKLRLKVGGEDKPGEQQRRIARARNAELPKGVDLFQSPDGHPVLVGRNATANDALVVQLLRGRDWWLHVRDQPGAHLVLRWRGAGPPPEAELVACAVLAAHLSGIDKGARVEVSACLGKGVRKVKGAPPGAVYLTGERSLRVLVEAEVVDAFYGRRPAK